MEELQNTILELNINEKHTYYSPSLKLPNHLANIVLVGYGKTQYYQIKCFKCNTLFFGSNIGFCEDCLSLTSEELIKFIPSDNLTDSSGLGIIVDWLIKLPSGKKRSTYNYTKVLKRDSYICRYCEYNPRTSLEFLPLHVDHVFPWSAGGNNSMNNLVTSCSKCNLIASSKVFTDFNEKRKYILQRRLEKNYIVPKHLIKFYELNQ
jgi:hypothetical protein